jgi:hypothetical protein
MKILPRLPGLLSMMQNVLSLPDNLDKTHNPPPRVNKGWVRKDETIHPRGGVDSPSGEITTCLGFQFLS